MGIKEKNLQEIENLSVGDKFRVVTAEGNSRNIDSSKIGGGGGSVFLITGEESGEDVVLNKTWQEIHDAFVAHIPCYISYTYAETSGGETLTYTYEDMVVSVCSEYDSNTDTNAYIIRSENSFIVEIDPNGYPVLQK